jgi:predicted O-methyltransferase YrrM
MEKYLFSLFANQAPANLDMARLAADGFGKGSISLGDLEAQLMSTLIRSHGCKKFVEIGTLTGASALWILQGLGNDGELWTFEKDVKHADEAKKVLANGKVNIITGDAVETLASIEKEGPFDGIFIDGNKGAYGHYLDWAEKNLKKGALILADNVFLRGSVFEEVVESNVFSKKQIEVMRAFNRRLADPSLYAGSIVPTSEGLFIATKLF